MIVFRDSLASFKKGIEVFRVRKLTKELDEWTRRRLRMCFWKQWKRIKTKYYNLMKLGIKDIKAWEYANTRKSYWRIANGPILSTTLTNSYLEDIGYTSKFKRYKQIH